MKDDDTIVWFWIGTHAEYDQLLKRRWHDREGGHSCPPCQWGNKAECLGRFLFLVSLAPRQECRGSLNGSDGFEVEDGGSRFVGFFRIEGEVEGPVVEVVGVDEGLVDR